MNQSEQANKAELFRAVVRDTVAPNIEPIRHMAAAADLPFGQVVRMLLPRFAEIAGQVPHTVGQARFDRGTAEVRFLGRPQRQQTGENDGERGNAAKACRHGRFRDGVHEAGV